ncbi:MAG TPA: ABC transporter ATP-binding protein [Candidatus Saccharimonadia bacterium]|nr:ABC transporter ATP-binding protein [Candidatus Saccharimonadia bacterium]
MTKPTESKRSLHVRETLALYWNITLQFKKEAWLALLLPISSASLSIFTPFFASKVLANIIIRGPGLWTHFAWFASTAFVGVILNIIGIRACMAIQAKVAARLNETIFTTLLGRSVGFYSNQVGGKLVSDALDYVTSYGQLFNAGFISGCSFVLTIVIGLVLVIISNWIIGLGLAVLLAILVYWTFLDARRRSNIRVERLKIAKRMISHLSDSIVNAVTVKTFAQEAREFATHHKVNAELEAAKIRDWQHSVTSENERIGLLLFTQIALVFGLIILTARNRSLLAGGIFAFTYTLTIINRFFTVNTMTRQIEEAFLNASPMTVILSQEPEISDTPDATQLTITEGAIDCTNVSFHYSDAKSTDKIFENLNLHIKPGEKIGLVGHSGGGKSTLTRLLLRFDDATDGTITIDSQEIRSVTQTSLREAISYVPQEPLLFHRSIRENIAYGNIDASETAIKKAARMAYAHDFITQLPEGYDTLVGERGVKLSGGQRQRVAIARAILKNAPILVLDEATSALDSESEKLIQKALWELMEGKTAVVIAHRLSTIQKMDRILVLDHGKITEDGSHKELLKKDGTYAKLWAHQSGGFIEE